MNKYNEGFTLIEIMIAIAIIGILSSIAIVQYQVYIAKSQSSRIIYELADFKQTIEICLSEGKTNIGTNIGDCTPNVTGSNLMSGGSQVGVLLPANTGVAQFSNPLTTNATVTADISNIVAPPLRNKKIQWQRSSDGFWLCKSNILQKFMPPVCIYDGGL